MTKSGLIFGGVSFVLLLGVTLFSPFCVPILGLLLGLVTGYFAGVFGKPNSSSRSVREGGLSGLIAGGMGFVGVLVGGVINVITVNAAAVEELYKTIGIPGVSMTQSQVTTYQLVGAGCIGVFNVVWMAILGIAGGALWYQFVGKNQATSVLPPQEPLPPSL